jgi:nitrite reductase/ring-hydroxylating ferredoxin subunit
MEIIEDDGVLDYPLEAGFNFPNPNSKEVFYYWTSDKIQIMVYWFKGSLKVHSAICPHMGADLQLERGLIKCPWHALCASPDDLKFNHQRYRSVRNYSYKMKGDKIYINEQLPRGESSI